jgi:transposase
MKKQTYFSEVIRLHYEKGYSGYHISRILPVGKTTVYEWIAIFAAANDKRAVQMQEQKPGTRPGSTGNEVDIKSLQAEIARLQAQLKYERMRADAYNEMINIAEAKFNIPVRKKAGAKR